MDENDYLVVEGGEGGGRRRLAADQDQQSNHRHDQLESYSSGVGKGSSAHGDTEDYR